MPMGTSTCRLKEMKKALLLLVLACALFGQGTRVYDVLLTYAAAPVNGWALPANYNANLVVFVNGVRVHQGADFVVAANVVQIAPANNSGNMLSTDQVTCDYDSH